MANETLKQLNIDVNSNVDTNDRLKTNLKEFLDTTTVEAETKTAWEPLFTEVKNDAKFDERLESAVNKQHVTKLLEAMKAKLDSDGYAAVYANYRTTITFAIQSALRIMGFPLPKENIDGKYGTETGDAVEAFQKRQGLTPDRLAGKDTISKMLAVTLDAKYDGSVAPTTAGAEESKEWYTTHTEFTEKEFGGVKNKVYTVDKFEDIPTTIAKDTVIDFGSYYFFSNGAVYEYSADGKTLVRKGDRSELDDSGKWKAVTPKTPAEVVVTKKQIVTPEKSKARTQEVNEDIYKVCDTTLRDVLNPFNKETKAGIESRLNPIQKAWYNIHIIGKETNSMTSFVIEQKNPSFTVSIWDRAVNSSRITLGTIPFESYYKDNKFFKEGVYDRIVNLVQGRIDSENQALAKILKEKKNQETKQNIEKILNEFRGSMFTLNELFPDKVGDMTYEGYFNKFDDKKLEIRGSKYTKVIAENLNDITKTKVQFDLNDDGDDEKYNINKTVMLGDILANGKYNRAKAIEVLKPIVKDIVEKNFTV